MPTVRRISWLLLPLIPAIAFASSARTTTPLSYSTSFTDESGTPKSISFTGTAADKSLTGTLTVDGAPVQVTATIGSDGSVSGKLVNPDGRQGCRRDYPGKWT